MSSLCVRGMATYRARFEQVFPLWRDKHRELIAVGDAVMGAKKGPAGVAGPWFGIRASGF
jgi:hypothetical protein